MTATIRPMLNSECEKVARFFHDMWHETQAQLQDPRVAAFRGLGHFRRRMRERSDRTIVAIIDGSIAGFASWTDVTLNSLFIAPQWRGRGFGALLCEAAEQSMLQSGTSIQLFCVMGNHAARAFYERQGWRVDRDDVGAVEVLGGTADVAHWIMVKG